MTFRFAACCGGVLLGTLPATGLLERNSKQTGDCRRSRGRRRGASAFSGFATVAPRPDRHVDRGEVEGVPMPQSHEVPELCRETPHCVESDSAPDHRASGRRAVLRAGRPHESARLRHQTQVLPHRAGTPGPELAARRDRGACPQGTHLRGLLPGVVQTHAGGVEEPILHRF